MRKLLIIILLLASPVVAKDFFVLISRAKWNSVSVANKQKVKSELQKCTDAPIPIRISWNLVEKTTTNEWGYALYSDDAWVLRQKESLNTNMINKIKDWVNDGNGFIGWTTNAREVVKSKNLKWQK